VEVGPESFRLKAEATNRNSSHVDPTELWD
jgi:hypothetical protein